MEIAGPVDEAEKWRLLGEADLLCAPSLGGESFGMVLTEAFASGTPVVASDIAGYRRSARDAATACSCRSATRWRSARRCGRWPSTPTGARRWPRPRASAPSASPGRTWPARWSTSTRTRSASRSPRGGWRVAQRHGSRPAEPALACRRSACRRSSPRTRPPAAGAWRARRPARGRGCGCGAGHRAGIAGAAPAGDRVARTRDRGRHAGLGAGGLRAHVRLDAAARRGLERDPARRAAGHPRAPPHRARHDDRSADVRDAAGPARRAVARADRGETRGPRARPLPDRARHARLRRRSSTSSR